MPVFFSSNPEHRPPPVQIQSTTAGQSTLLKFDGERPILQLFDEGNDARFAPAPVKVVGKRFGTGNGRECRFGERCTKADCKFVHPAPLTEVDRDRSQSTHMGVSRPATNDIHPDRRRRLELKITNPAEQQPGASANDGHSFSRSYPPVTKPRDFDLDRRNETGETNFSNTGDRGNNTFVTGRDDRRNDTDNANRRGNTSRGGRGGHDEGNSSKYRNTSPGRDSRKSSLSSISRDESTVKDAFGRDIMGRTIDKAEFPNQNDKTLEEPPKKRKKPSRWSSTDDPS